MLRTLSLGLLLAAVLPAFAQEIDVKKSKAAWNLVWEDDWVTAVVFPSNNRLVAGNEKGDLLVWELPTSADAKAPFPSRLLKGHNNGITKLRATPDGRYVISASKDKTIRFWDMNLDAGVETKIIIDAKKRETNAKKNGKPIPETPPVPVKVQEAVKVFEQHKEWVLGLDMTPDAKTIISGDDSGRVLVWERESGKIQSEWKTKGWVHALAISPDAKLAVVGEQRPLIFDSGRLTGFKVWDAVKGVELKDFGATIKENMAAAAFSADGAHFAVARSGETDNGKIYLFETKDFKKLKEYQGHMSGGTDLHFSANGKYLFTSGRDTTVKIWSVADGKLSLELGKPRGGQFKDIMHACAVSPDQRWAAGADMAGLVQVWKLGE